VKLPVSPPKYDRYAEQQRSGVIEREILEIQTFLDSVKAHIKWGTGTPENSVSAPVGTSYLRADGGANTTLYVKESGTGNTGWIAK
jgi:hypothetical protein